MEKLLFHKTGLHIFKEPQISSIHCCFHDFFYQTRGRGASQQARKQSNSSMQSLASPASKVHWHSRPLSENHALVHTVVLSQKRHRPLLHILVNVSLKEFCFTVSLVFCLLNLVSYEGIQIQLFSPQKTKKMITWIHLIFSQITTRVGIQCGQLLKPCASWDVTKYTRERLRSGCYSFCNISFDRIGKSQGRT